MSNNSTYKTKSTCGCLARSAGDDKRALLRPGLGLLQNARHTSSAQHSLVTTARVTEEWGVTLGRIARRTRRICNARDEYINK
eukprot:4809844-Pyramimonas_sp.AAC.1